MADMWGSARCSNIIVALLGQGASKPGGDAAAQVDRYAPLPLPQVKFVHARQQQLLEYPSNHANLQ